MQRGKHIGLTLEAGRLASLRHHVAQLPGRMDLPLPMLYLTLASFCNPLSGKSAISLPVELITAQRRQRLPGHDSLADLRVNDRHCPGGCSARDDDLF